MSQRLSEQKREERVEEDGDGQVKRGVRNRTGRKVDKGRKRRLKKDLYESHRVVRDWVEKRVRMPADIRVVREYKLPDKRADALKIPLRPLPNLLWDRLKTRVEDLSHKGDDVGVMSKGGLMDETESANRSRWLPRDVGKPLSGAAEADVHSLGLRTRSW